MPTTPTTTPIGLTDEQMNMIYSAVAPLEVRARAGFLEALATALRSRGDIGDGELQRAIVEAQRKYVTNLRAQASWHH